MVAAVVTALIFARTRFVPAYFTTVRAWLAKRIRGFGQG
jgi:hypothetical protein